jgi:hypothetical protein
VRLLRMALSKSRNQFTKCFESRPATQRVEPTE